MIAVRFTDLDEFLRELEHDVRGPLQKDPRPRDYIDGGVVRVTQLFRPHAGLGGALTMVTVMAGWTRPTWTGMEPGGATHRTHLTYFEKYVGDVMPGQPRNADDAYAQAAELVQSIEERASDLGCDTRAGMYDLPKEAR